MRWTTLSPCHRPPARTPAAEPAAAPGGAGTGLTRRTFLAMSATGLGAMTIPGQALAVRLRPRSLSTPECWPSAVGRPSTPARHCPRSACRSEVVAQGKCSWPATAGSGPGTCSTRGPSRSGGADFAGTHYAHPLSADTPGAQQFRQGFALRTVAGGAVRTRTVDAAGFADVRFTGQYPIGHVAYSAPDSPVEVTLDAFSPFVPLETLDSTHPGHDHGVHPAEHVGGTGRGQPARIRREPGVPQHPAQPADPGCGPRRTPAGSSSPPSRTPVAAQAGRTSCSRTGSATTTPAGRSPATRSGPGRSARCRCRT